jgi:DNA-binding NarL/FixJ family response regulator
MADMSLPEISASQSPDRVESNTGEPDAVRLSATRARVMEEAGAAIARQLNGPLTALLLYMGEIKQHSHEFSQLSADKDYLREVVDNAMQQTERVCALVKQIARTREGVIMARTSTALTEEGADPSTEAQRRSGAGLRSKASRRSLTKREREVLNLISQGYSNKQGASRMCISPRTFESHRAEAMRKLGARNTADLVRAALLHPID